MAKSTLKRIEAGSPISQIEAYNAFAGNRFVLAMERLDKMLTSTNESVALGAVKIIVERVVPAKKAMELSGNIGFRLVRLNVPDSLQNGEQPTDPGGQLESPSRTTE